MNITIVEQMDPGGTKIGGIATCIKNFIKFAPEDFRIRMVGVTTNRRERPVGIWREIRLGKRVIDFLPLLYLGNENTKTRVPLSLKFFPCLLKARKSLPSAKMIWQYHRIEPALAVSASKGKQVLFVHGHVQDYFHAHTEIKWRRLPRLYYALQKRAISRMSLVFCVREDGAEFLRQKYPQLSRQIYFLPTWVDEEVFFPLPDGAEKKARQQVFFKAEGLPQDSQLVLFVGRLEDAKDPDLLIAAFHILAKQNPHAVLMIVGEGSRKKDLVLKTAQSGLSSRVLFAGQLPQERVADVMRLSRVLLLTSHFEGMPCSVLEALACGLAVVSCDVGEVRRVVREGVSGSVVSRRSAQDIADAAGGVLRGEGFTTQGCVTSIGAYTARGVLEPVYQRHRELP